MPRWIGWPLMPCLKKFKASKIFCMVDNQKQAIDCPHRPFSAVPSNSQPGQSSHTSYPDFVTFASSMKFQGQTITSFECFRLGCSDMTSVLSALHQENSTNCGTHLGSHTKIVTLYTGHQAFGGELLKNRYQTQAPAPWITGGSNINC